MARLFVDAHAAANRARAGPRPTTELGLQDRVTALLGPSALIALLNGMTFGADEGYKTLAQRKDLKTVLPDFDEITPHTRWFRRAVENAKA